MLMAKNVHGERQPYVPSRQWVDGSVSADLPAKRLARLYGVNHFITSFASEFKKVGRLSVDESMANHQRIITEIRNHHGAFVVMLNVLTVDPGRAALDYSKSSAPNRVRRRSFNLALTDLARRLDFPILDVDRITKQHGISGQADYVHYTPQQKKWISREFAELVVDSGVLGAHRPRQRTAAAG